MTLKVETVIRNYITYRKRKIFENDLGRVKDII